MGLLFQGFSCGKIVKGIRTMVLNMKEAEEGRLCAAREDSTSARGTMWVTWPTHLLPCLEALHRHHRASWDDAMVSAQRAHPLGPLRGESCLHEEVGGQVDPGDRPVRSTAPPLSR